ncbi:hypothetical protein [Streptomyces sp. HB2AG]|uniref:hypothetical protein n=1 Tax=Streptomyces sp. HB2AG TaxID=2983400 RepID=UPI0022AB2AF6|nr:hypothetical protein [Streptomyces sp. HB2AG]MCZ2527909.1 hypothetical protein [Streptomyces sp. HB2AG]
MSFTENDGPPTRTRLPETRATGQAGGGTGRRSPRSMVTVAAVVVLLVAAIAFANRGSGGGGTNDGPADGRRTGQADPTAPTGVEPVTGKNAGIASGFARTEQGAQSAAANYAVALGSDGMFRTEDRHRIVDAVYTPDAADKRRTELDKVYSDPEFLKRIGLDEKGSAPEGMTFVSRTNPVGSKIVSYERNTARVAVWYSSLFGLAGDGSTTPVSESWYTSTFDLKWADDDWRVADFDQKEGPAPVGRDQAAASAKDMTEAVEGFGGFTYAR